MDLRQINYVLTVARIGNVTRAAEMIHISQSALSQAIHGLERELGLALFRHEGRLLVLTEDGEFFCREGEKLLKQAEQLEQELAHRRDIDRESLRFYAENTDSCDETMIIFSRENPQLRTHQPTRSRAEAVAMLKNGNLDFIITVSPPQSSGLDTVCLIDEPVVALVRDTSALAGRAKVTTGELRAEILLIYRDAPALRQSFQSYFKEGERPMMHEVFDPLLRLRSNGGCILLAESAYNAYFRRGILDHCVGIPLEGENCRRRLYLSRRPTGGESPVCRSYLTFLQEYFLHVAQEHCLPDHKHMK